MKVFDLFATLTLDTGQFTSGLDAAVGRGRSFAQTIGTGVTAKAVALGNILSNVAQKAVGMAINLGKSGVEYNASMQDLQTNLGTLLGSADAAAEKIKFLKDYAVRTPFDMTDLASATQTLLSFNVAAEDVDGVLQMLGDVSLGDRNKFQSLALVFGQIQSTGKLMGQDLLQLINQGFNPLQIIAEKTGASMGDLKKVMSGEKTSDAFQKMVKKAQDNVKKLGDKASSADKIMAQIGKDGAISADVVAAAFKMATEEGGQFYQGMENASKTYNGLMSTLIGGVNDLVGKFFTPVTDYLTNTAIPAAINFVDTLAKAYDTGGWPGMISAAVAMVGDLAAQLTAKAEELLPGAANSVIDVINGIFGTNLPHIDSIKFPTWDEISQTVSSWWNGGEGQAGGIAGLISGVTTWALGILNGFPDLQTIVTSVTSWWSGTAWPGIQHLFSWALVGDPDMPPLEAVKGFISTWVNGSLWPAIQSFFKWAFGIELPNLGDIVAIIKNWVDTSLWPAIQGFFKWAFGIELPNLENVRKSIESWWNDVKSGLSLMVTYGIKSAFGISSAGGDLADVVNQPELWDPVTNTYYPNPSYKPKAVGLDYVPYDDFPALLHEGEAVLTKSEAAEYRQGAAVQPQAIDYDRMAAAISAALSNVKVQISGREVGELVAPTVSAAIAREAYASRFAR